MAEYNQPLCVRLGFHYVEAIYRFRRLPFATANVVCGFLHDALDLGPLNGGQEAASYDSCVDPWAADFSHADWRLPLPADALP